MRTITLEEHVTLPELVKEVEKLTPSYRSLKQSPAIAKLAPKLEDITGERLASMDAQGITMQVLSVAGKGADLVEGKQGIRIAQKYNDTIAERSAIIPTGSLLLHTCP